MLDKDDASLLDDSYRKGVFREEARVIMWKDRDCRKHGGAVDTGGAVARAMEQAYKLGMAHAMGGKADPVPDVGQADTVPWTSIPARARGVFDRIVRSQLIVVRVDNSRPLAANADLCAMYRDRGERVPQEDRLQLEGTFSGSTLAILTRLGLMIELDGEEHVLAKVSRKGLDSWKEAVRLGKTSAA